eukprot:747822-Hanusia_phi.AAC.4
MGQGMGSSKIYLRSAGSEFCILTPNLSILHFPPLHGSSTLQPPVSRLHRFPRPFSSSAPRLSPPIPASLPCMLAPFHCFHATCSLQGNHPPLPTHDCPSFPGIPSSVSKANNNYPWDMCTFMGRIEPNSPLPHAHPSSFQGSLPTHPDMDFTYPTSYPL